MSLLDDDGEQTPVTGGDGFPCTECDEIADSQAGLNAHRWRVHRIRKDGSAAAEARKTKARPPRRRPAATRPASTPRASAKPPLSARLEQSFGLVGVGVGMIDRYDGQVIVNATPDLCRELAAWADADPKVRPYIEMLCLDLPYLQVLLVVAGIAWPILEHHRVLRSTPALLATYKPDAEPAPRAPAEPPAGAPSLDGFAEFVAANPDLLAQAAKAMGGSGFAPPFAGAGAESPASK